MADDKKKDAKPKDKAAKAVKADKPQKPAKAEKASKAEAAAAAPKPEPPPRPPADPRLKVMKKFRGRFLPRGPLRDRYQAILQRWDSGEDHGGVTVEELKSLLADWRASRVKPVKSA
jgi:hypothetical protein